jgi:outer membrane receptor protein involved in Fe transport
MLALALLCVGASYVWGATTGAISGLITDAETNEPVVGASILVVGTNMGTSTDEDGRYLILNVPGGETYTLRLSSVGYATLEVSNVVVSANLASYQDHALSSRATDIGTTIQVIAETPMVIPDKVSSVQIVKAEELLALPTRGFEEVVGIQTGVVASIQTFRGGRSGREATNAPELYVRGGRPSEVAFYVDGYSQQDPLTGTSTANISNNAIREVSVVSGGFPVEYGHVMSGIVNVITQSGTDKYSGTFESVGDPRYEQTWLSGNLGGPIPGLEKGYFFGSLERRDHQDRNPSGVTKDVLEILPDSVLDLFNIDDNRHRQPNNWLEGWAYQGKLDYNFTNNIKLSLSGNGSNDEWQEYLHQYLFNNEHSTYYKDDNLGLNMRLTHTLNEKTFYNLSASYFVTERFRGDGVHREDLWAYGRTSGNPQNEATDLFFSWDDPETPVEFAFHTDTTITPIDTITADTAIDTLNWIWVVTDTSVRLDSTIGDVQFTTSTPSDSGRFTFIDGGTTVGGVGARGDESSIWDDYLRRKSSYIGIKGDITSEIHREHTIKAGFEFNRHTLRFYQHLFPQFVWRGVGAGGFQDINRYGYDVFGNESDGDSWRDEPKNPIDLALYLQDRIEYRSLIITAGLRFDYFDYKGLRLRNDSLSLDPDGHGLDTNPDNDLGNRTLERSDLEESEKFTKVSPRIGVAFPVSDHTQMRVSYGKFFQRPDLQNLYVGYDFLEYQLAGLAGYFFFWGNPNLEPPKTTAYDVGVSHQLGDNTSFDVNLFYRDVTGLVQVVTLPSQPVSFSTFRNQDYGTIKGLEFAFKMRRTKNMMLDVKYTLSYATGTGSFNSEQRNIAWVNGEEPKYTSPLEYDQRHKLAANFDLRFGENQGPKLGETYILENFGLNVLAVAGSGLPYTPVTITNEAVSAAVAPSPIAPRNSARRPWTWSVDLKLERAFSIADFKIAPYLWVKNLLDRDNAINAWEGSGRANSTGWLPTGGGQTWVASNATPVDNSALTGEEKYQIAQQSTRYYSNPRQFLFGLRVSF